MATISRESVRALATLDDARLRRLIYDAAKGAGIGEITARMLCSGTGALRERILAASDEEIDAITAFIGEARVRELLNGIAQQ